MALAVGIAGELMGAAEVEMRLPRIAKRPTAIVALKIDEHFWFVASVRNVHDLHALAGPPLSHRATAGNC